MFISVILSAAPPRLLQTETLEREVEGPRGFFFLPCCIREFSRYLASFFGTIHHHGVLKLSFILLEPDIAEAFPNDEAVNQALRGVLEGFLGCCIHYTRRG